MQFRVLRSGNVSELRERATRLGPHKFIIALLIHESHDPGNTAFAIHQPPWETPDGATLVQQQIDISAQAFRMNDAVIEHLQMHKLSLVELLEISKDFRLWKQYAK